MDRWMIGGIEREGKGEGERGWYGVDEGRRYRGELGKGKGRRRGF